MKGNDGTINVVSCNFDTMSKLLSVRLLSNEHMTQQLLALSSLFTILCAIKIRNLFRQQYDIINQ